MKKFNCNLFFTHRDLNIQVLTNSVTTERLSCYSRLFYFWQAFKEEEFTSTRESKFGHVQFLQFFKRIIHMPLFLLTVGLMELRVTLLSLWESWDFNLQLDTVLRYEKKACLFQVLNKFSFQDLYEDVDYGVLSSNTKIKVKVNPSGCVILKMETIPERFSKRPLNPYFYRHNQN